MSAKRLAGLIAAAIAIAAPIRGGEIEFRRVADTATPIPNGSGPFIGFEWPTVDQGVTAFRGNGADQDGIYRDVAGSLMRVADMTTAAPGTAANFTGFDTHSGAAGVVAFRGFTFGDPTSGHGIFAETAAGLQVLADQSTPIPGGSPSQTYQDVRDPSVASDGSVVFYGRRGTLAGIYQWAQGSIETLVDTDDPIPGGSGSFQAVGSQVAGPSCVAFIGWNSSNERGVYLITPTGLETVADWNTLVPGTSELFTEFGSLTLTGCRVVFGGGSESTSGYYTYENGVVSLVVDLDTPVPGGGGEFNSFGAFAASGDRIVFDALLYDGVGSFESALFSVSDGTIERILSQSGTLDGKQIVYLGMGDEALGGDELAFIARFDDGSRGIYVATFLEAEAIPTMTGPLLMALGLLLAASGRRARSRP